MFNDYHNWSGTRKNLIGEIIKIENNFPNKFKMISKKTGDFLKFNERRIQQFIDEDIIPRSNIGKKGFEYSEEHLLRYLGAIYLKNNGNTLKQIQKILQRYDLQQIKDLILEKDNSKDNFLIDKDKVNLSDKLKKIGRIEGRVLRSQWMKFAVTKWCNVEIKKQELKSMTEDDFHTIILAFELSLKETMLLIAKDELDKKIL